ncbi:hypothetical protein VPH35_048453 [Triticum aestivum]
MEDDDTAEPAAKRPTLHIPHDVVTAILLELPVSTLLRLKSVCKAWHRTISEDSSFHDAHLHRHRTDLRLLIAPRICTKVAGNNFHGGSNTYTDAMAGLYLWDEDHPYHAATALVHPMPFRSYPVQSYPCLVHCDGLVLVGIESAGWVLNPATRRILPLHRSFGKAGMFGIGRDPRSKAYKVLRFYHRPKPDSTSVTGYGTSPHVEVFTIGRKFPSWHETAAQPPCHVKTRLPATFFKGSLLWIIDHCYGGAPLGLLRLRLDDETFSIVHPPPCWTSLHHEPSSMSVLRQELCMTTSVGLTFQSLDMWICIDLDTPQWEKRHNILSDWTRPLRPVAVFGDGVLVCRLSDRYLCRCTYQPGENVVVKHTIGLNAISYYNIGKITAVQYPSPSTFYFDAIPYVPRLVSI